MTEISLSEFNTQPRPASRKRPTMSHSTWFVVGAVVLLSVGFLGGMQYQKGKTPKALASTASASQFSTSGGPGGFGGGNFQRGARTFGTVTSVSSSSITIQTRNGSTSTYTITSSTTVMNAGQTASTSDIQQGDTVVLSLDTSNQQDVTSIMLNPSFGGFGGSAPNSGSSSSNSSSGATGA